MSQHFSKHALNTYAWTSYFEAVVPPDYPLSQVLQTAKAFRRLPLRLREAAANAKRWAVANGFDTTDIDRWYDADGYELDPDTGDRLTDAEIDAQWAQHTVESPSTVDIPEPAGGFPDPDTWNPPPDDLPDDLPTRDQILADVASRGIALTEAEYGIDLGVELPADDTDGMNYEEVQALFADRTDAVLASDYFDGREEELKVLQDALPSADTFDDLWGPAEQVFTRVEEYELVKAALPPEPDPVS